MRTVIIPQTQCAFRTKYAPVARSDFALLVIALLVALDALALTVIHARSVLRAKLQQREIRPVRSVKRERRPLQITPFVFGAVQDNTERQE